MVNITLSKKIGVIFACFMLIVGSLFSPLNSNIAFASTDNNFEKSTVIEDLKGSTLNGQKFDLANYPFDEKGSPKLISFLEYCYSYKTSMQDNYALYIYIYNPQGKEFNVSSNRNKIQLRAGETGNFEKYELTFLNYTNEIGYEGLFYKFKVKLNLAQRNAILGNVKQNARVYEVSGYELCVGSEVTEYKCATKYTYTGFAKDYGPPTATSSTLSLTVDGISDTLSLKVNSTYYRPEGANGKNQYTQDSLHSVYFAVPNSMIKEYGEMTAVHATWLNAVTKPAIVTGNQEAFKTISDSWLGVNVGNGNANLTYAYAGAYSYGWSAGSGLVATDFYKVGYDYNCYSPNAFYKFTRSEYGSTLDALYMIFNSGTNDNSADTYTVASEEITNAMLDSATKFGGELVNDKYSKSIFASVDSEFTDINIESTTEYNLTNKIISQNFWQEIWGNYSETDYSDAFNGIKAIQAIDKTKDLEGTNAEISKRLFVGENDCEDLKAFCNSVQNVNNTVYLFRYQVSDYIAQEASLLKISSFLGIDSWSEVDTNAYFFQQTVNLDFDIIDVTFTKDNVKTVIPVVMSPIDIIHDGTSPIITEGDGKPWVIILAIIAVIVLIIILWPVLPYIAKGIAWVVMLPVKAVKGIAELIDKGELSKEDKQDKDFKDD